MTALPPHRTTSLRFCAHSECARRRAVTSFAGIWLCREHYDRLLTEAAAFLDETPVARTARRRLELEARSVVYFIRRAKDGLVKIGYSSQLSDRLYAITREVGPAVVLGVTPGYRAAEASLHERFRAARVDGEWFQPTPELLDYAASLGGDRA